jgi:hypothetical protein
MPKHEEIVDRDDVVDVNEERALLRKAKIEFYQAGTALLRQISEALVEVIAEHKRDQEYPRTRK